MRREIDFTVRIPPDEAVRRLMQHVGVVGSLLLSPTFFLQQDFVGTFWGHQFSMRKRHRYSNGFVPILKGQALPHSQGSRIIGRFHSVWFAVGLVRLLMAVFLTLGLLLLYRGDVGEARFSGMVLLGLFCFLILVEIVGRKLAAPDYPAMIDFLEGLFQDVVVKNPE